MIGKTSLKKLDQKIQNTYRSTDKLSNKMLTSMMWGVFIFGMICVGAVVFVEVIDTMTQLNPEHIQLTCEQLYLELENTPNTLESSSLTRAWILNQCG